MRLAGKVAVVTGASKGIGAGIAKALGREGATVVVNYVSSKVDADAVAAAIDASGGKGVVLQADMSSEAEVVSLFAAVARQFSALDVLVNNAGVAAFGPVAEMTAATFHRQFNLNVLGYFLAIRESLSLFGAGGGSIINISSILSTDPYIRASVYAATKGAVDTMTLALARELAPRKIRVNAILPGHTITPATDGHWDDATSAMLAAGTPFGRLGGVEDIAPAAVFLACADSNWITGEAIRVAGGARGVGY